MESSVSRPDTINNLRFAVDAAFAMLAGIQLDVFTSLKDGSKTADQIAKAIGVGPDRLKLLLYSLVSAGLLDVKDGLFANNPETGRFLVRGSPDYLDGMRWADQWNRKFKTAESIRTGVPQSKLDFSNSPPEEVEAFLRRINRRTVVTARGLVERFDFSSTRTLVDIGGGAGGLAVTITKACPHIQATVVDLPQVIPVAQKVVEEEGATDRVKVLAADVVSGPLPGSYDTAVLKNLIQVLSPGDVQRALMNISEAINPGGTIHIVGQILDDSRTTPPEAVGFNLLFINYFDVGESYTEQEHREWLTEAGFVGINRANLLLPGEYGLITAQKPT